MKMTLCIVSLLLILSCNSSKKDKINCDAFVGTWTSDVKNSKLTIALDGGDYIFTYDLTDPNDPSGGTGSSGQVCKCIDKGLTTEEKDLLTITDGKIKFRGQVFAKK